MRARYLAAWAVIVVLGAVVETAALFDPRPGDTLSELVRLLVSLAPEAGAATLIGAAGWFVWHILRKVR
ncbi:MAG: hypothetical protein WC211_01280 [Dehalococcoidia bacterium]